MIYWILHKPLTNSDLQNGIEGFPGILFEKNEAIVFLDITNYSLCERLEFAKKNKAYQNLADISIFNERFMRIKTRKALVNFLKNVTKNDVFVFQDCGRMNVRLVVSELNKRNLKTVLLNHWRMPDWASNSTKKNKKNFSYFFALRKVLLKKIVYKITMKNLPPKMKFDYVFSCGKKYDEELSKIVDFSKTIKCHSVPYDEFLAQRKKTIETTQTTPKDERFIVFVDQALTLHPDNARYFSQEFSESYHKEILESLRFIKKREGLEIIIAQHPRIQFPKGYWEEFECRSGQTARLISESKIILGHFSTALLQNAFLEKSTIILNSSNIFYPFKERTDYFYNLLGTELFDMNSMETKDRKQTMKIPMEDYFSLIPSETEKSNFEIFLNFFNNF